MSHVLCGWIGRGCDQPTVNRPDKIARTNAGGLVREDFTPQRRECTIGRSRTLRVSWSPCNLLLSGLQDKNPFSRSLLTSLPTDFSPADLLPSFEKFLKLSTTLTRIFRCLFLPEDHLHFLRVTPRVKLSKSLKEVARFYVLKRDRFWSRLLIPRAIGLQAHSSRDNILGSRVALNGVFNADPGLSSAWHKGTRIRRADALFIQEYLRQQTRKRKRFVIFLSSSVSHP